MKCNPNPAFLRVLASLGAGFDCASKEEIRMARETGVPSAKLIYANPCKAPLHIKKAKQEGVKMMTFDNVDELRKIHQYYPEAELVLRILPDDSHSLMKFGSKFGAASDSWETLYAEAKRLQLNVIGVSFHVGSGCFDAIAYEHALKLARSAFDLADRYGFEMTLLDIGGGFPGSSHNVSVTFPEIAAVLRPLLDELFPDSVRVIAEPGRYFAEPTMTFVSRIHSKRTYIEEGARAFKYYIHDGVYGAFNCIMFDHAKPEAHLVFPSVNHLNQAEYKSTVFGPTCDSIDKIVFGQMLPELEVGQWLFFPNMGAYTTAAASTFNGFQPPQQFYVISELQHKKICIDDTGLS
jgi:ornithine decarboxylase